MPGNRILLHILGLIHLALPHNYMETLRLPKNLPDAMLVLDELLTEEQKTIIRNYSELEASIEMHFTLGHWIRNQWLYNPESPLGEVFRNMYFTDEDSKSSLITKLYHRHVSGVELNWEEELADLDPMARARKRQENNKEEKTAESDLYKRFRERRKREGL